jgi:UTP:GlnB (protein PII) uridylyltransferase
MHISWATRRCQLPWSNSENGDVALSVESARDALSAASAHGHGGRAALQRFSDCVDHLLQRLFDEAPGSGRASLVVALGGYGRRQLCLQSDIDILLLFDGPIGAAEEGRVRSILHPLWDLHFSVGHQIRQMDDFAELEIDNPSFFLPSSMRAPLPATGCCSTGSPPASTPPRLTRESSTR